MGELKWIKNRILVSFIAGPKIQGRGHFLTNQIRIITYSFWSLNIFLLISFWGEFSRMFLFSVFSWLVKKYKSVTSMLMRFWLEISTGWPRKKKQNPYYFYKNMWVLFFWGSPCMFWGLVILRLKKYVYSISPCSLSWSMSSKKKKTGLYSLTNT